MSEPLAGIVVVDKPEEITSHGVVGRVRRLAGTRKVGHAGTLDPMATGVLVLGVNRATRLLGHLMLTSKAYDATIRLGQRTTTDDREGEPLGGASAAGLDAATITAALAGFEGEISQRPSAVSAIKVDGKRAYQRVRDGEDVELPAREVTIHRLAVHDVRPAGEYVDVDVSVECSSGTYIRAIARDLGDELGVGGHLTALRRTAVGPFTLDSARTLEELTDEFSLLEMPEVAARCFPTLQVDEAEARAVATGRRLERELAELTAILGPDGAFLALYEPAGSTARPVAVFVG